MKLPRAWHYGPNQPESSTCHAVAMECSEETGPKVWKNQIKSISLGWERIQRMSVRPLIIATLLLLVSCRPEPVEQPSGPQTEQPGTQPGDKPQDPPVTPPDNPPSKPDPTIVTAGEPLPLWQEGYLDIHSINGGRGESFYYILPDGTTMLVDAAGAADFEIEGEADGSGIKSRPSQQYSSGNVIVQYINHFAPEQAQNYLDYFMTSHYHGDHMGIYTKGFANYGWKVVDRNGTITPSINLDQGGFLLNGIQEVGYYIPIKKLIDRGDWDNRASNVYLSAPKRMQNYLNFIDWSKRKNGTVREKLAIGHIDQITLIHSPAAYPQFSIRGIAAGGDIWTGNGTGVNTSYLPPADQCMANIETWDLNENILSCVFTLSYGKFDWFSGGDIQYNGLSTYPWKDIEKPISQVVGKVEAMKACHHSTSNTNSTALLKALKPDNYIIGVWTKNQPNPATLKRVYSASPQVGIFATNMAESIIAKLKAENIDPGSFCAQSGHIVLRVLPGGGSYYIYVLDDSDFTYRVSSVHGPFQCQ